MIHSINKILDEECFFVELILINVISWGPINFGVCDDVSKHGVWGLDGKCEFVSLFRYLFCWFLLYIPQYPHVIVKRQQRNTTSKRKVASFSYRLENCAENDSYQYARLIKEPTRVALDSKSFIDLFLTNEPDKFVTSGVSVYWLL